MIEWNNFYGAILIDCYGQYEKSKNFILNEVLEKKYYHFHPAIFSIGIQEHPYFYDDMLLTFGRTVKYLASDTAELELFISEFEDILGNIDFNNAQVRMDTDYANYDLFWRNKLNLGEKESETIKHFKMNEIKYFESDKYFFGVAEIDLATGWARKYDSSKISDFERQYSDFKYPFKIHISH